VYHKILPVRDVEVLPARHWVPGPDGRLIQVDEKDVYSGAAWSVGQTNATSVSAGEQDQVRQSQTTYNEVNTASQPIDKHTSVNPPEVLPGQVKQVYQTQVHQPGVDSYHAGLGQVERSQVNQTAVHPLGQHPVEGLSVSQREVQPGHARQTQLHHSEAEEYQIPRKPVGQDNGNAGHIAFVDVPASRTQHEAAPNQVHQGRDDQSHEYSRHQDRVGDPQATQSQINPSSHRKTSQPLPSPYEIYETNPSRMNQIHHSQEPQHRTFQSQTNNPLLAQEQTHRSTQHTAAHQTSDSQHHGAQGLFHHKQAEDDHAKQNRRHQERGVQHSDKHTGHHDHVHGGGNVDQRHVDQDPTDTAHHRDDHQTTDRGQVSPGLLDPYRVKNGPVHHADQNTSDASEKPLPELPVPSVQKIAGHSILTTEDKKGHTKLHKEPK